MPYRLWFRNIDEKVPNVTAWYVLVTHDKIEKAKQAVLRAGFETGAEGGPGPEEGVAVAWFADAGEDEVSGAGKGEGGREADSW
jgi:hypothetical protein